MNLVEMKLYHYWRSSSSWRVRWALIHKKCNTQMIPINLLDGESESESHLKRHPLGYVPVLEVEKKFIIESVAIIEYLEELIPTPALFPGTPFERAHIRALVEVINADTQPIQNLSVTDFHTTDDVERTRWNQHFIRRGLHAFEALCAQKAGQFSVGDQLTAADIFLVPQCYNALRNKIDLSEFPVVKRIFDSSLKLKSCEESHPDRFKPE